MGELPRPISHQHGAQDCPEPDPSQFKHWPPGIKGMHAPGVLDLTTMNPAAAHAWLSTHLAKASDQPPDVQAALGRLPLLNRLLRLGWDPDRSQVLAVAITVPRDHRNITLGHHLTRQPPRSFAMAIRNRPAPPMRISAKRTVLPRIRKRPRMLTTI